MIVNTIESGVGGDAIYLPNRSFTQFTTAKPCRAGIVFGADGVVYEVQSNDTLSAVFSWLLSGTASGFYISRVVDSGAISTDAGAGPLQLNVDRRYSLIEATFGNSEEATVTFEISSDVSGTPVVADNQYLIRADLA